MSEMEKLAGTINGILFIMGIAGLIAMLPDILMWAAFAVEIVKNMKEETWEVLGVIVGVIAVMLNSLRVVPERRSIWIRWRSRSVTCNVKDRSHAL
jgi:hypothetical protein